MISFNKESRIFFNFDQNSDAFNPVFKEKEIIFNNIDPSDETSFNLIILIEIGKSADSKSLDCHICGMNVIPLVSAPDTIVSGIFEIPMLDIEMSPEVFQELNIISPWQFQYKYLKEKKVRTISPRVVYRQSNTDLSVWSSHIGYVQKAERRTYGCLHQ